MDLATQKPDPRKQAEEKRARRRAEIRRWELVTGSALLVAAALLLGLKLPPPWLGWLLGAVAIGLIIRARPPG